MKRQVTATDLQRNPRVGGEEPLVPQSTPAVAAAEEEKEGAEEREKEEEAVAERAAVLC